ncbi:MAG: outer membrane lipoprotein carrier protein LolA [Acidobacteriales bacterium]|nr:outer membrane lipoprotein carrier protein LolA [Terriglobales bacterium]
MKVLSLLLLLCAAAAGQSTDLKAVTDTVDRHYNHLTSLKADFVETYSGNGISRQESGTLLLRKPGKMLWNYTSPQAKVFVTDGKTAWFYVPGEQQARKAPLKKLDDLRSPLRYLLGSTKLLKEFNGLRQVASNDQGVVLAGVPKGMEDRVTDVALTVKGDTIVAIRIEQTDGSTTEFKFNNIETDVPVSEAKFKPQVPAGVQWIDSEDLSPQ